MNGISLKKIGELVSREGKKSHDMIVVMFKMWLVSKGVLEEKIKVQEEILEVLPDIVVLCNDKKIESVWEIIEPEEEWNLRKEEVKKKLERLVVRTYLYLLKPSHVILTDGRSFIVYDSNSSIVMEINDLCSVNDSIEKKIEELLIKPCMIGKH
ncbi:MAG: hypothetical protein ACTSX9_01870 [Candidatus Njordarchaeales archaeon]